MTIASGQLARHIGLPWRPAAGVASNTADMQAASETHMGLWAAMLTNATLTVYAAGWQEGGLTFGYEKFINDIEALQTLAELCSAVPQAEGELAWSALADVAPGGTSLQPDIRCSGIERRFIGRWSPVSPILEPGKMPGQERRPSAQPASGKPRWRISALPLAANWRPSGLRATSRNTKERAEHRQPAGESTPMRPTSR